MLPIHGEIECANYDYSNRTQYHYYDITMA